MRYKTQFYNYKLTISVPIKHRTLATRNTLKRTIYHTCTNHTHNISCKEHVCTDKMNTSVLIIHTSLTIKCNFIMTNWWHLSQSHTNINYKTQCYNEKFDYTCPIHRALATRNVSQRKIDHICTNHTHRLWETFLYWNINHIYPNHTHSVSYMTQFYSENLMTSALTIHRTLAMRHILKRKIDLICTNHTHSLWETLLTE